MTAWNILFGVVLFVSLSRAADFVRDRAALPEEAKELVETLEAEQTALYRDEKAQIEKTFKDTAEQILPHLDRSTAVGSETVNRTKEALGVSGPIRPKRQAAALEKPNLWIWSAIEGVNYFFDPSFSQKCRDVMKQAIAFYEAHTCIVFNEVAADSGFWWKIRILPGPGCESPVGKQAALPVQNLSLGADCENMAAASKVLGHALGFLNAQARHDRDEWVWVNLDNIAEENKARFVKSSAAENNNFGFRYDFRSIMHDAPRAFSVDQSAPAMVAYDRKYQMAMGASQVPVFSDIAQLNNLYECNACAGSSIQCARGGYPHPKNCTKCICPSGFGGDDCSQPQPPSPNLACGQTLAAKNHWQELVQNFVCGNGEYAMADVTNPSLCTYHIQAPTGHRVEYWVNFIGYDHIHDSLCEAQCRSGGLDVKGGDLDLRPEGYRLCCQTQMTESFHTAGELLVIQAFNNFRYTDFQIMYRIDPCGAILTATPQFQWLSTHHVVGNGLHEVGDRNNPKTCTWTIEAPAGSKLLYALNFVGFDGNRSALCFWNCWYGAVEVQGDESLKFCCPQQESQLVKNEGNKLTVKVTNIFRYTEFKIQYAIDPCVSATTSCLNGGVPDPNSCGKCECLPGFSGADCSQRAMPTGGALWSCGTSLVAKDNWQWYVENNVVGLGSWTPLDPSNPVRCTYHIVAPEGKRVEYEMNFVGFDGNHDALCLPGCANGGVMVRGHGSFWQPEGKTYCCHNDCYKRETSGTNVLVLEAWNSLRYTNFQIGYRVV